MMGTAGLSLICRNLAFGEMMRALMQKKNSEK
jgi:hypothetical protein